MTEDFTKYIEDFKAKPLKEKQTITIEQLKLLISLAEKMCESKGIKSEFLFNSELLDLNQKTYTPDDYVEALIVYINILQNYLCDYNINQ